MKKKICLILALICLMTLVLAACNSFTCDECGKKCSTAYYGLDYEDTMCKDCATKYWAPLPIEGFKK